MIVISCAGGGLKSSRRCLFACQEEREEEPRGLANIGTAPKSKLYLCLSLPLMPLPAVLNLRFYDVINLPVIFNFTEMDMLRNLRMG